MRTVLINKILLFAIISTIGRAQTVNTGTMVVSPGTVMSTVSNFNNKPSGDFLNDGSVYIYANFNNDGLVSFSPDADGYTRFQGFLAQKITGTMPSEFKNVLFYNSNVQPAFQLYGEINVFGNSDFNRGIVDNDSFGGTFTLEQDAVSVNTWNGSFVDGKVIKKGNVDFVYPIGDKNKYRYARISGTSDKSAVFTGKYFYENSNLLYPHTKKKPEIKLINDKEYWTITKEAGMSGVLLTLSWDENETTPETIVAAPENEIHIVRWDVSKNLWIDEGGVSDVSAKTVTTTVDVTGYGVFTLARVKDSNSTCIKVYNAVTPNADNINDYFLIECINNYPKNTVEIYNRWGVKVFGTENYDSKGNVFRGYSDGRMTVDGSQTLPSGTYFYILTYEVNEGEQTYTKKQAGYLYLEIK